MTEEKDNPVENKGNTEKTQIKRAYSVDNVLQAKFNTLEFDGIWRDAVGCPELSGTWIVYGSVKNGKTSFTMMLAKYLTRFEIVAYNSVEEGLSLSMQESFKRTGMEEVKSRFLLLNKENQQELIIRLRRRKSPNVVIIDSLQFWEMTFKEYKELKEAFPNKLFIYISHATGNSEKSTPDGNTALRIWRDANVSFRIEGFKAFPIGRYGGGKPVVINGERAVKYWAK
jgi:hypothetical protein